MKSKDLDIKIKEYTDKINELKEEKDKILVDELKNYFSLKESAYYKFRFGDTIYYFKSKDIDFDLKAFRINNCLEERFMLMMYSYKYYSFMYFDYKENVEFEEITKEEYLGIISKHEEALKTLKEE